MEKEKKGRVQRVLIHRFQGDSSEIEVTDEFFEIPECPPLKTETIKMIGHCSRLRNVMDQSHTIYVCTRANHARCSSLHATFCGSSKYSLLIKVILGKKKT